MAEYAGLEIRIGGDTTKLTNALRASTKSAAELQSRIRQATRAMQFDPTNLGNIETRIRLTGDRMQSLQSYAQITRTAMQQLGDSMVRIGGEGKKVSEVVSETQNLSLAAKQADERFNGLTGSLAEIYEAWNRMAQHQGTDIAQDILGVDKATVQRLMSASTSVSELRSQVELLNQARQADIMGTHPIITDDQLQTLIQFKQLNFHDMFKRGFELDDIIAQAEQLGVTIEESAIENVRKLQEAFKRAQQDKEAYGKALQLDQLASKAENVDSEIVSLSNDIRRLDDGMTEVGASQPFQGLESRLREVDASLDSVNQDLEHTEAAMKLDPGNLDLAARYFKDLQQQADLSKERVSILTHELTLLNMAGAEDAASEHQDLARWVEESAEAARRARIELSDARAETSNLTDQAKRLNQELANMRGDSAIVAFSNEVTDWQRDTQRLATAMKALETAEANVTTEQEKLATAQLNFDNAQAEANELKERLESLRAEYERLEVAYEQSDDSADFASMIEELNRLDAEIKEVETAYGGAKVNVREFGRQLDWQRDAADLARKSLEQQRTTVSDLKQSVDDLSKTKNVRLFQSPAEEIERTERQLESLESELAEATARENELEAAYSAAQSENELAKTASKAQEVSASLEDAKNQANEAQNAIKGIDAGHILNPSTIKSIGMTLSATVTPALSAVGYKMIDASSTIDSAYRDMRKTVQGTEEEFEALRQSAINFSQTHVTSADQILQIEAIGGELGIATENLETFAEVISNLDVATNLNTEDAATALGHLANILHLTEDDYVGFSDALVRLGNNGASTESEIANIAERIGSMGSIVGMSGSDILAWASTIASTGQNAEAAGTAISKTMSFMETAVAAAGGTLDTSFESINAAVEEGGDKLTVFASLAGMTADEFVESWETGAEEMSATLNEQLDGAKGSLQMIADVAHMSADELAKMWESDPTEALKAFISGLNDLEGSGGSADKVLEDLGITSVRQKQAIEGLMQTIGGLDDNLQMSEDAWNGVSDQWGQAGDAANEATKKAEGFSGQIQILKNMWQNFLAQLGEGAVPYIKMATDALGEMSSAFASTSDSTKQLIVGFGGFAAMLGPMLSLGATAATAVDNVHNWSEKVITASERVRLAFAAGGADAVKALTGSMTAMDKFKVVAVELGKSLATGLGISVIAATAVIGVAALGAELMKLYNEHQTHIKATEGLSTAIAGIGKSAAYAAEESEPTIAALARLRQESDNYEERLANLTDTISRSNEQYGAYAGQLDYYASVIGDLAGKSDRTEEETSKLSAALEAVNEQCGKSYAIDDYGRVVDTLTGKVQENSDAILANIDLRKQQALIEYYADDYAQATQQWAEAQDKLNEAQEKYNELASEEGKQDYLSKVEAKSKAEGRAYDEQEALKAYEYELDQARTTMEGYEQEVKATEDAMGVLEGKISGAREAMDEANRTVEEAERLQEEYDKRVATVTGDVTGNMSKLSAAVTEAGKDDETFNAIADGLESIHVYANELDNVNMANLVSAFDDTNGSMEQVIATLEDAGVATDTWHAALERAPEAAEHMGSLTANAFNAMYEAAGGDIYATMELIAGLDEIQVGEKTFFIGDGGTIVDEQGRVYDLTKDIADIPDEVITRMAGDDTELRDKLLEDKRQLTELDEMVASPVISVTDYASSTISSVLQNLDVLGRKSVKATIVAGQATGGMNSRPVIPRHATGYIATGPTLTNQGWIGEDGIEAVANWATGGAVVPLTNKRYMLPIADAIASGIAARGYGRGGDNITIQLNYEAGTDANQMVRELARGIQMHKATKGRW